MIFLIGIAVGIMLLIGAVKAGFTVSFYIWRNIGGIILLLVIGVVLIILTAQREENREAYTAEAWGPKPTETVLQERYEPQPVEEPRRAIRKRPESADKKRRLRAIRADIEALGL